MPDQRTDRLPLIAHVIFRLDVGGLENGLVNLVNRIPASKFRQSIVCLTIATSFRDRIERDDVEVHALNKRPGKDFGHYVRLWRLFRELKPDVVHTRNVGTIDAAFPAKLAGVRVLVHGEHGWDVFDEDGTNRKYRALRRACAPLIDQQIAVSRHIAKWLERDVGLAAGRIRQIYNGVDTAKFRPSRGLRDALPSPGFAPPETFVIGTVGRMAEIKDPLTLVEAFALACRTMGAAGQRLRLVMVGDGPLRGDVNSALAARGVQHLAWLPGKRDDIDEILRGLDLFVLPSRNEGISNTILEAMATGLPVIATHVGGNAELVVSGATGTLVPARSPEAMAAAIHAYVEGSVPAKAHGAAGRLRAVKDFSLDRMLAQYLEVYDSATRARRRAGGL
jgi:sugar transferase (PEP-CTERM/EpsH1 system associated)